MFPCVSDVGGIKMDGDGVVEAQGTSATVEKEGREVRRYLSRLKSSTVDRKRG